MLGLGQFPRAIALLFVGICWIGSNAKEVHGQYSPEHPVVAAMVEKGVTFLESTSEWEVGKFGESEYGGLVIVGYTVFKVRGDLENPAVVRGIKAAERICNDIRSDRTQFSAKIVYDASISALLFCDVDPEKYRDNLITIRDWFVAIQKNHGGFGYLQSIPGDTSQTQYVMLAFWAMGEVGIHAPPETLEGGLRWLARYQTPEGGWVYQAPNDQQQAPTKSLGTAGLCATIIGADALRLFGERKKKAAGDEYTPKALQKREDKTKKVGPLAVSMSRADMEPVIDKGVKWQQAHTEMPSLTNRDWYTYWRYSQERYESFLEIVRGKQEKSPAWYNQGVDHLKKLQDTNGAWGTLHTDFCATPVATSFCVLYLIRSTQKAIGQLGEGLMFGGYGLPKDTSNMRQVGDKIVGGSAAATVDDLLGMLEKDDPQASDDQILSEDLRLASDLKTRRAQLSRLTRILGSKDLLNSQDAITRRIAAKLLAQCDDLNYVPALIYALGDGDPIVWRYADDGLRLVSRRLTEALPDGANDGQRKAAQEQWRQWYLTIRPEYVFLDE